MISRLHPEPLSLPIQTAQNVRMRGRNIGQPSCDFVHAYIATLGWVEQINYWCKCKNWNVDSGLDCGLDCGLILSSMTTISYCIMRMRKGSIFLSSCKSWPSESDVIVISSDSETDKLTL